jgi:hypothetical protein
MGDRREQMTIVGPDFRLARLESGRGVNGVADSQGNVGGGERIGMAVLGSSRHTVQRAPRTSGARGCSQDYGITSVKDSRMRFIVSRGHVTFTGAISRAAPAAPARTPPTFFNSTGPCVNWERPCLHTTYFKTRFGASRILASPCRMIGTLFPPQFQRGHN